MTKFTRDYVDRNPYVAADEIKRLQDVNADMLDLARNIAGLDARYVALLHGVMAVAVREWQEQARAAIAKAKGRS